MTTETTPETAGTDVGATLASPLPIRRYFTTPGVDPYDELRWELRTAVIAGADGTPVFEQKDVEFPADWSQNATNVVASKYFRGPLSEEAAAAPGHGAPVRERSVKQLIDRVVNTLTDWGRKACPELGRRNGYFGSEDEASAFHDELKHILVSQKACFNSPVWFNLGIEEKPQCSACFILSIDDSMDSILEWYRTEGKIFKGGSGSGINLSRLRSSKERLTAGGLASGPVSFMRGADAIAGTIKSGGKTRRAAKMVILNVDHPDIEEFIDCKVREERKAYALGDSGYDVSLDGDAWISIQYQNANNSVRVSDDFMRAVVEDREWQTRYVTTGEPARTYRARDLMRRIAEAAWECADPGIQYDTKINEWHTCPNAGPITASNPCSEYMHLDDSACNLASVNLLKFLREEEGRRIEEGERGEDPLPSSSFPLPFFDIEAYRHTCAVMITAQEIIVSNSSYPTDKITRNANDYRQLGLGYSNLGALLMCLGVPYDSDEGRAWAAALAAIMTGQAYATSAAIASAVGGPFPGYERDREPMLDVIQKHRAAAYGIAVEGRGKREGDGNLPSSSFLLPLVEAARAVWDEALDLGRQHGYRNSQATVLAPTGTISFMMDCDTTGIEPDIALVKYKTLVGGGLMKIVNASVPRALRHLGYDDDAAAAILAHVDQTGTIEGAPGLRQEHLPVFDCAFKGENGSRTVHWLGHVKMMGAVQPFISGAISKTVNLPEEATVEEIEQAFIEGWRDGLKALAVYRDGSKRTQVLSTRKDPSTGSGQDEGRGKPALSGAEGEEEGDGPRPVRRRLPATRASVTHKFSIEGHEGYITAGSYEDGTPGEIFVTMAKEGSTLSGMLDAFATSISLTLQYGVPLRDMVNKFSHMRFEPSGRTENPEIPVAQSIVDYIFRWLASQFLSEEEKEEFGVLSPAVKAKLMAQEYRPPVSAGNGGLLPGQGHGNGGPFDEAQGRQSDAPPCSNCGWIMTRCGTCYRCENCGTTSGCG